jgi:tetratricopeptide (TPR) repeat protein
MEEERMNVRFLPRDKQPYAREFVENLRRIDSILSIQGNDIRYFLGNLKNAQSLEMWENRNNLKAKNDKIALQEFIYKVEIPAREAFRKFRDFQVQANKKYREMIREIHEIHASDCRCSKASSKIARDREKLETWGAFEKLCDFHKNYVQDSQKALEVFESLDVFKSYAINNQVMKWIDESDWRDWILRWALLRLLRITATPPPSWDSACGTVKIFGVSREEPLEKFENRIRYLTGICSQRSRWEANALKNNKSLCDALDFEESMEKFQKFLKIHENLEIESANALREFQNNKCIKSLGNFQNQKWQKSRQAFAEFIEFLAWQDAPIKVLIEIEEFQGREEFRNFQIMKIIAEFEID